MEYKIRNIGFSLIEVVATVALLGLVAVPFLNIFLSGNKLSIESKEDLMAVNLARERIEQILMTNFENMDEDYYIYRDIYKDTIHNEFDDADEDRSKFYEVFSDIWTEENKEDYPRIYTKFTSIIESRGPLRTYDIYPKSHGEYRRYAVIEDYGDSDSSVKMKKITVYVINRKNDKEYKIATLVTDYK